jgi:hypothetical protein
MSFLLAHLATLGSLTAAFGLGGYAIERACLRKADLGPLRPLAWATTGVLLWMLALFALAALGGLGSRAVIALAVGCALAAVLAQRRWGAPRAAPGETGGMGAPGAGAGFALAAVVVTSPWLLLALRPEVSWDASAYHLSLPRRYLAAGGFTEVPFSVYAHWPQGVELLFAAALSLRDHALAKALHWAFGVATLWALLLGARGLMDGARGGGERARAGDGAAPRSAHVFGADAAGWLAAPLVLANPIFAFELSVAYVDLAYAFFFLASLLFAARWRQGDGRSPATLVLAGVCAGALCNVKVTGALGAAAVGGALVLPRLSSLARRGAWRAAGADAARFSIPVLLLWAPWLVRSALETGNPLYPLFWNVFGGPDWSPRLAEQFSAWQRSIGPGRSLVDYALLPLRVVVGGGPHYSAFQGEIGRHWLVLVPLALWFHREPRVRAPLAASAVYFVLWALGSQQMRFLIPVLPPLALAGAAALLAAAARLPARGPLARAPGRRALFAVALVLATAYAGFTLRFPLLRAAQLVPSLAGDAQTFREAPLTPAERFVATLPADARLLLLGTNQVFFLEREAIADSFFEASQIADWLRDTHSAEDARARLRERGVTHVLVERGRFRIDWPAGLDALLADRELLVPRFRAPDGRVEILELR